MVACCLLPYVFLLILVKGQTAVEGQESGAVCTTDNGQKGAYHQRHNKDGYVCCEVRLCVVGTEPELCTAAFDDTGCVECPVGTYQDKALESSYGKRCKDKICPDRDTQILLNPNDRTSRPDCECNVTDGYYHSFGDQTSEYYTCRRSKCEAGHQLTMNGTCQLCPVGYFKEEASYDLCKPVTHCVALGREVLTRANSTSDAVCGFGTKVPANATVPSANTHSTEGLADAKPATVKPTAGVEVPTKSPHGVNHDSSSVKVGVVTIVILMVLIILMLILVFLTLRNRKAVLGLFKSKTSEALESVSVSSGQSCESSPNSGSTQLLAPKVGVEHPSKRGSGIEHGWGENDKETVAYQSFNGRVPTENQDCTSTTPNQAETSTTPNQAETTGAADAEQLPLLEKRNQPEETSDGSIQEENDIVPELTNPNQPRVGAPSHQYAQQISKDSGIFNSSDSDVSAEEGHTEGDGLIGLKSDIDHTPMDERPPPYTPTASSGIGGHAPVHVNTNHYHGPVIINNCATADVVYNSSGGALQGVPNATQNQHAPIDTAHGTDLDSTSAKTPFPMQCSTRHEADNAHPTVGVTGTQTPFMVKA